MNATEQARWTHEWLTSRLHNASFADAARERTLTAGKAEYYDAATNTMRFETLSRDELLRYTEEELLDLANYAWMLRTRFPRFESLAAQLAAYALLAWKELARTRHG